MTPEELALYEAQLGMTPVDPNQTTVNVPQSVLDQNLLGQQRAMQARMEGKDVIQAPPAVQSPRNLSGSGERLVDNQMLKDLSGVTLGEKIGNVLGTQKYGAPEDKPFSQSTLPGQALTLGATAAEFASGATQGAGTVLKGAGNVGVGGLEYLTGTDIVQGMGMNLNQNAITPTTPTTPAASAAQAMKEQLGIPAPSDMSPNVPVGTGTVLKGPEPMPAFQDIRGIDPNAPVQSAPKGMVRTIDPNTGQPIFADKATAAQFSETINARRKADFEAQQRAIQQISSSGIGYRLAEQEVAREQAASAAREADIASRPDFMESVSDSQRRGDGLSDSEMRRYIKGKNPNASDREKAYSARIDMQRRDEATQTAAQQAMDLAQMRIDASVESQDKTIAAQQEAAKVAQENALKLASIRQQLSPSEAREAELKIIKLEQDAAAGQQVDPSDIQKILTSVGVPTLNDIKYDAQRDVFVNTKGIDDTFGPESAAYRILAGTKVGRTIMGGGPNMRVVSTKPVQG